MQSTLDTTSRTSKAKVKVYFDALYPDPEFRKWLISTNHKNAITRNVLFDRHEAIIMIKQAAAKVDDFDTMFAPDGYVYKYLVRIMTEKHAEEKFVAYPAAVEASESNGDCHA